MPGRPGYDLESDPREEWNLALADPVRTKAWLHGLLNRHTLVQHLCERDRFC